MLPKSHENFLMAALIGGALGAAATLFLTPMSGSALRDKMLNGFQQKKMRKSIIAARPKMHAKKSNRRKSPTRTIPHRTASAHHSKKSHH